MCHLLPQIQTVTLIVQTDDDCRNLDAFINHDKLFNLFNMHSSVTRLDLLFDFVIKVQYIESILYQLILKLSQLSVLRLEIRFNTAVNGNKHALATDYDYLTTFYQEHLVNIMLTCLKYGKRIQMLQVKWGRGYFPNTNAYLREIHINSKDELVETNRSQGLTLSNNGLKQQVVDIAKERHQQMKAMWNIKKRQIYDEQDALTETYRFQRNYLL